MGVFLWLVPLMAVLLSVIIKEIRVLHAVNVLSSFILVFFSGLFTMKVMRSGILQYDFLGGIFYLDALSIIILDIVVLIAFLVSIYSIGYLNEESRSGEISGKRIQLFYILTYLFLFTMILALTVNNIGVLWIAMEGSTLASAFLVGFHNDKHSLEAAWKYVVICSVGIAMALVGIIFLHLSSVFLIDSSHALQWNVLYDHARELNTPVLRLSFLFVLIGFGTKAGLVPMHTWLPDAHSQAPSPISALLSGVLLNSALYAVIRILSIVNKNQGDSRFAGRMMIGFGLVSIVTAGIFILTQKDYKRLLAYSSIEHIGIITLAIGLFTPLSVFAGLFHMINHSFTKAMLFLASGNILQKYGTRTISNIRGLLNILPASGMAFLIGLLAISGTPPFSIFASEVNVFLSVFAAGHPVIGAIFILLLAFIFVGIAVTLFRIFYGEGETEYRHPGETNLPGAAVLLIFLLIISVTGIYMPDVMKELITSAQRIIIGG